MTKSSVTRNFLSNGIEWICDVRPGTQFYAAVSSKQGSETPGVRNEVLHLFEHMMFDAEGPKSTHERHIRWRELGIKTNGGTLPFLCYGFFDGPTKNRGKALSYIADAVFHNPFSKLEFRHEKHTILQELPQLVNEDPWTRIETAMSSLFYPDSPYGLTHDQSMEGLRNIKLSDLRRAQRQAFCPENTVVITISAKNGPDLARLVQNRFGRLSSSHKPAALSYTPPPIAPFNIMEEVPYIGNVAFVRHSMKGVYLNPDSPNKFVDTLAAHWLADEILVGHDSSFIFNALRVKSPRCYSPKTGQSVTRPEPEVHVQYSCAPKYVEGNTQRVRDVFEQLASQPLSKSTLGYFQNFAVTSFKNDLLDPEERIEWYAMMASNGVFTTPSAVARRIKELTPKDMQRLFAGLRENLYTYGLVSSGEKH